MLEESALSISHRQGAFSLRPQLPAVTGLRFLAAMHVYLTHAELPLSGAAALILVHGGSAVSFFFVLSGFILAYNYGGETKELDRRTFWIARFARIYPVYLLAILVALPKWLGDLPPEHSTTKTVFVASTLLAVLLLVQSWNWSIANAVNGPAWSLSTEAFFYAIFPVVIARLRRWRVKRLILFALGAWLGAVALALALDMTLLPVSLRTHTILTISNSLTPATNPAIRSLEFMFGAACGCAFLSLRQQQRIGAHPRWDAIAFASLIVIVTVYGSAKPTQVMHNGALAPLYALLIIGAASGAPVVSAVFGNRAMIVLGEASYALYLLHTPIIWAYDWLAQRFALPPGREWTGFGIRTAATIVVSCVVLTLIEQPSRRAIRRAFG